MRKTLILFIISLCFGYLNAQDTSLPMFEYTIDYVVDGDTFHAVGSLGHKIKFRPIGIDTPETGKRDGKPEPYHQEATDWTKSFLLNKKVIVQYDVTAKDRYLRDLVYVYLPDGTFFNLEIMKAGWAVTMNISPNVKHADLFREAQNIARANQVGVWQDP